MPLGAVKSTKSWEREPDEPKARTNRGVTNDRLVERTNELEKAERASRCGEMREPKAIGGNANIWQLANVRLNKRRPVAQQLQKGDRTGKG